jgi:hypothetical protein
MERSLVIPACDLALILSAGTAAWWQVGLHALSAGVLTEGGERQHPGAQRMQPDLPPRRRAGGQDEGEVAGRDGSLRVIRLLPVEPPADRREMQPGRFGIALAHLAIGPESARLHLAAIRRRLDREEPDYAE